MASKALMFVVALVCLAVGDCNSNQTFPLSQADQSTSVVSAKSLLFPSVSPSDVARVLEGLAASATNLVAAGRRGDISPLTQVLKNSKLVWAQLSQDMTSKEASDRLLLMQGFATMIMIIADYCFAFWGLSLGEERPAFKALKKKVDECYEKDRGNILENLAETFKPGASVGPEGAQLQRKQQKIDLGLGRSITDAIGSRVRSFASRRRSSTAQDASRGASRSAAYRLGSRVQPTTVGRSMRTGASHDATRGTTQEIELQQKTVGPLTTTQEAEDPLTDETTHEEPEHTSTTQERSIAPRSCPEANLDRLRKSFVTENHNVVFEKVRKSIAGPQLVVYLGGLVKIFRAFLSLTSKNVFSGSLSRVGMLFSGCLGIGLILGNVTNAMNLLSTTEVPPWVLILDFVKIVGIPMLAYGIGASLSWSYPVEEEEEAQR